MWVKIAVGLATPFLALVLVVGVLIASHRTSMPALTLPSVSSANVTTSSSARTSISNDRCLGRVSEHFAGLAVKKGVMQTAGSFAQATGHAPQVVEFYNPLRKEFASGEAKAVIKAGEIPFIQLNPKGAPPSEIAAGKFDKQLREYASAVKAFGCAIILSFGHEMNGWWYRWGEHWTSPQEFIAAWRHIHNIFTSVGASNVTWSWDPSHQYNQVGVGKVASPASEWYPGSKYVDIVGLDGYLGYDKNRRPQNFKEVFSFQLRDIRRVAPHKLVYLAETGVAPGPAAKMQIKALFAGLKAYHLSGLVWFDAVGQPGGLGKTKDYRLQHLPEEARVYTKQLGDFLG